jgi:UDP-N-acetylmuramoyl-tripeptide--D-alanyl-D-alanine ligase
MTLDVDCWISETGGVSGSAGVVSGWSTDSRTLVPGDLYFALRGPSHDGHDYVEQAIQKGAAAVVVDHPIEGVRNAVVVEDTLRALQLLAGWARKRWGGDVIGVTGSAGKTTTKDSIADLLSVEMKVGKTIGNLNNHVGTPLSILRLPEHCRAAVLEMGMNHAGEIGALAEIARPNVGVVTNVGYAHAEYFDNIEGVALAKRELIDALPEEGTAVLNADDPRVSRFAEGRSPALRTVTFGFSEDADVRAGQVELDSGHSRFEVAGVQFEIPFPGRHGVMNALAAIAVATVYGIPLQRLTEAARSLHTGKMRGERIESAGITILNDCYNANPEAVRAMVDVLGTTPARRRLAVLGEMLELGRSAEPLHREVGSYVAGRGIDVLIGIRGASRHMVDEAVRAGMSGAAYFFEDPGTAGDFLRRLAREGDAVLFKGSRGVAVEKAMERLLAGREA